MENLDGGTLGPFGFEQDDPTTGTSCDPQAFRWRDAGGAPRRRETDPRPDLCKMAP
jgi:hypothetical protein